MGDLDKARAAEALHLRRELGDALWPGWGATDIPMIFYNEDYAFLIGLSDPPAGWLKIPEFESRGGPWEAVPDDTFEGEGYYRQPLASAGATPEAFIVRIGDRWVSNLLTADWMEIHLGNEFRGMLPPLLQSILPYRFAARAFLSVTGGHDLYICAALHESFHAYEAILAQDRLLTAETVYNRNATRYPFDNSVFAADWQMELDLLADAVQAGSDAETDERTRRFLDRREKRRTAMNLDAALIDLERLKEWEEGLAKYTELAIWRLASEDANYKPLPVMDGDPGFTDYSNFEQIWLQQIQQIRSMAKGDGDTRFYYSGLAQAVILDRLAPGWRTRILAEKVWLEDLLKEAVQG
ncbi:MAG: hypothetical protein A3K46_07650 [Chloroflexi bacterium RBG_13_60_9]|nr:MAG: hypothetical protein A3K46_07650 [Chloroflexi bacterium RBG_13_60_9]